MLLLANADKEIVGLNVTMQEVTRVNKLNALQLE